MQKWRIFLYELTKLFYCLPFLRVYMLCCHIKKREGLFVNIYFKFECFSLFEIFHYEMYTHLHCYNYNEFALWLRCLCLCNIRSDICQIFIDI